MLQDDTNVSRSSCFKVPNLVYFYFNFRPYFQDRFPALTLVRIPRPLTGSNRWIWEFFAPSDAAGLDGPSGAHETLGESLGAEKIRERTLEMTAAWCSPGLVRSTPLQQPWLTRGAPRRPPGQAHDS